MGNLNRVMLIGYLGSDPEKGYTSSGIPVINISIATNEKWFDDNGKSQERTEWHRVVIWRALADVVERFLSKGNRVYIEGKLQTNRCENDDGKRLSRTEVICHEMRLLDLKLP
jgi:single-strand DNA-binding protein